MAVVAIFIAIAVAVSVSGSQSQPNSTQTPGTSEPGYPVNVTIVDLQSPSNACGLNGTTEPGWHGVTNASSGQTWKITAPADGCTIDSVNAITGGFYAELNSIGGQSIPGGQTAGVGVSYLMLGLGGPYSGPLVLSVG